MEYGIVALIVAAFIIVVFIWAKKTNERQAERMKMLSQEQLDYIKNFGYTPYNGNKNTLETIGVLTHIKESSSQNVPVDFIFWNCCTQKHELGDSKISKDIIEKRNLKVGDYIHIVFKFKDGIINSCEKII